MPINIIHKGSMPDSSSTTYPMGAHLFDILFSFVLENILSAMYVDWGPPHLSLVVLYMSPTDTSSMQNLILQELQQKLQKLLFSM